MALDEIFSQMKKGLDKEYKAREKGLALSRNCIQLCANSIRAAHRDDLQEARSMLAEARGILDEARGLMEPYQRIYHAGFLQDAEKEYAEASATIAMIFGEQLPGPESIGVGAAPYLNGLGEAVGEMRRHVLDLIRTGKLDRGEEILGLMEDIYYLLTSVDYPSAMTGGLKRTSDMVRGVLERTRGDLTTAIRRRSLERTIKDLEGKLGAGRQES